MSCAAGYRIGDGLDHQRLGHFLEHGGAHGGFLDFSGQALRKPMSSAGQRKMGASMTDLYATARAMLADLKAKKVSARELLDAHLARNDEIAKTINAVIETDIPRALKDAAAIDEARAKGAPLGPLAGLPMTIKDGFDVENMPADGRQSRLSRIGRRTAPTPIVVGDRAQGRRGDLGQDQRAVHAQRHSELQRDPRHDEQSL